MAKKEQKPEAKAAKPVEAIRAVFGKTHTGLSRLQPLQQHAGLVFFQQQDDGQ